MPTSRAARTAGAVVPPPVARRRPAIALRETAGGYRQHDPRETLLYGLVSEHLEPFLAEVREQHERGLPDYVEQELRAYLQCGLHAFGFGRARCRDCGRELVVAFSCKKRSVCPSCNARRMCGTAAFLTDHVFPEVPVRQWVLSVPFALRLTLARRPDALSLVGRVLVSEILRYQREAAGALGLDCRRARSGAVQFPQRFGGSLNLNVHYHVAVPDGVFVRDRAPDASGNRPIAFHPLPRPSPAVLGTIVHNVEIRVTRWLRRKGLLPGPDADADFSNEPPERSALDACLEGSLGLGELTELPGAYPRGGDLAERDDLEPARPTRSARRGAQARGFDLHAGVAVAANDREGRERLLRYCARPPLSLERLSRLPDGRIAYELRKPWGRQTHRVMEPLAFMARLAALVPPPRHPLIRFHGVFAPHSSWRAGVVPHPAPEVAPGACRSAGQSPTSPWRLATPAGEVEAPIVSSRPERASVLEQARDGEHLCDPGSRIPWAELLKRTHDIDALACPCGGRLQFIAVITDHEVARDLLESLGLPSAPPPLARARSPDLIDPIPPDW